MTEKKKFKVGDTVRFPYNPELGQFVVGKILDNGNLWPRGGKYANGEEAYVGVHPADCELAQAAKSRDYVADHARRTFRKAGLTKQEAARVVQELQKEGVDLSQYSRKVESMSSVLWRKFVWEFTPEGHEYWLGVTTRIEEKEKQDAQAQ